MRTQIQFNAKVQCVGAGSILDRTTPTINLSIGGTSRSIGYELPMTREEAQKAAPLLYRDVRVTVTLEEVEISES